MRTRSQIVAVVCAAAFAVAALPASYRWTGSVNSDWNNSGNWYNPITESYPALERDDAELPADPAPSTYNINLVTLQIQDLDIYESYDFAAASGSPVLQVEELTIYTEDAAGDFIVLTITGAEIRTHE